MSPPYWGTVGNWSTETSERSVCWLFKRGRKWHVFIIFCTMPDVFGDEIRGTQSKLCLDSFLPWYSRGYHTPTSRGKRCWGPSCFTPGDGAAQKYLKNQWQSQKQNHGPEAPQPMHFTASSPPASCNSFVNSSTLPAATTDWKGYYLQLLLSAHHFSFQRITQTCQLN